MDSTGPSKLVAHFPWNRCVVLAQQVYKGRWRNLDSLHSVKSDRGNTDVCFEVEIKIKMVFLRPYSLLFQTSEMGGAMSCDQTPNLRWPATGPWEWFLVYSLDWKTLPTLGTITSSPPPPPPFVACLSADENLSESRWVHQEVVN